MIFLRYESFRQYLRLYPITSLLILINVLVFLAMTISGGSTNNNVLIQFGAMLNLPPYDTEYWRYVSAIFVHIGFLHLLYNTFAIFVFAPPLERLLGRIRYLLLYLGSGIAGNILSELLMHETHLSAGASGSIFGVYGGFLFLALFRKHVLDQSSSKTIMMILAIGLIYSFIVPHVNIYAHIGGFIGGFVLYYLLTIMPRKQGQGNLRR